MCHNADSCYRVPRMRVRGYACKTNLASNTAMRGFGIPQAYFVMETAMEHLARVAGISSIKVQAKVVQSFSNIRVYLCKILEYAEEMEFIAH